uniref:Uncharacterized protein n=1 Tax=Setaria digitata TaxID=48799 RepID=A0A915PEB2_9BILA
MGNRNAKSTVRNSQSSSSLNQQKHLEEKSKLLRSISTYSRFPADVSSADEKENKSKWLTNSRQSLSHAPSANSMLSSISIETIQSHNTADNSALSVASDADGRIYRTGTGLKKRSYTVGCSDIQRIHVSCCVFDEKNVVRTINDENAFQLREKTVFSTKAADEAQMMRMPLKNSTSLLMPKSMSKLKSFSASWLIETKPGNTLISIKLPCQVKI